MSTYLLRNFRIFCFIFGLFIFFFRVELLKTLKQIIKEKHIDDKTKKNQANEFVWANQMFGFSYFYFEGGFDVCIENGLNCSTHD